MTADPITLDEFSDILERRFGAVLRGCAAVAVGVSGGPDSLALVKLLSNWAAQNDGPDIHALTVDHTLRPDSTQEAALVASLTTRLHYVKSNILEWDRSKENGGEGAAQTRIQEEARRARYDLMEGYCAEQGIQYLFLGHHQDDQAETFLFRLAKGSGLDGLAAMKGMQERGEITLLRPLLDVPKDRLIATCETHGLEYLQDPSNESEAFARVRLRQSMDVLEEEGLSVKRLVKTAIRLSRARIALEQVTGEQADSVILEKNTQRVVLDYTLLSRQPNEIALRLVLKGFALLRPEADYAPRMEKVETLFEDLIADAPFRKRTLGGVMVERDDQNEQVIITKEA